MMLGRKGFGCALLGLLALALQAVLSFGHHHDHHASGLTHVHGKAIVILGAHTADPCHRTSPLSSGDEDDHERDCGICWSLTHAQATGAAHALLACRAVSYARVDFAEIRPLGLADRSSIVFVARGPPAFAAV